MQSFECEDVTNHYRIVTKFRGVFFFSKFGLNCENYTLKILNTIGVAPPCQKSSKSILQKNSVGRSAKNLGLKNVSLYGTSLRSS